MGDILVSILLFFAILFTLIIILALLFMPSAITIFVLNAKTIRKKVKWLISISVIVLNICALIYLYKITPSGFGPDEETIKIDQQIGGELVCQSIYTADIHSWDYDIEYIYINQDSLVSSIGYGNYSGEEWQKNEQIQKIDNWLVLETSANRYCDKLIIGAVNDTVWKSYTLSSEFIRNNISNSSLSIEREKLSRDEIRITSIDGSDIAVDYIYTENSKFGITRKIELIFNLAKSTGKPYLKEIK